VTGGHSNKCITKLRPITHIKLLHLYEILHVILMIFWTCGTTVHPIVLTHITVQAQAISYKKKVR